MTVGNQLQLAKVLAHITAESSIGCVQTSKLNQSEVNN